MRFCCKKMEHELWNRKSLCSNHRKSLVYDPMYRTYSYYTKKRKTYEDSELQQIFYCPFCGKKLPTILYDEFYDELAKVRGVYGCADIISQHPKTGHIYMDVNKLPKEFQSDEWWIKRGL